MSTTTSSLDAARPEEDITAELEPTRPARDWLGPFRRHPLATAFVVTALVALIANYPVWPGDPTRLVSCRCGGNEDPAQTAWFLAWTPYAILHGLNPLLTGWINVPQGADLAQNTSMPLLGLITAPITWTAGPVASENLLRWLAFPLSAVSMQFVLRRWVRWEPAAFVGGLVYGFSPYVVGQASAHLNLCFVPLPPLIFLALYELLVRQKGSALRWGLLLGGLSLAQFFICSEILGTTFIAAGVATVFLVLLGVRAVPRHFLHTLRGIVVGAGLLALGIAYPVYLMTHGPLHYIGPSQGTGEIYNADLLGAILPTTAQLVAPYRYAHTASAFVGGLSNVDENGSYLGIPLLVVALYLAARNWRKLWTLFALLMAATMFVFSLGPVLHIDGKAYSLPVALPFSKLDHLPFIEDALPARISLYVVLFLAVLVALGLDAGHDRRVGHLRRRRAIEGPRAWPPATAAFTGLVALGAAGAVVVSLLPAWPYPTSSTLPPRAEQPAGLAMIPAGSTVLTYPYAYPFDDDAMLWQAVDGMRFKLFGSYMLRPDASGAATPFPRELGPLDVEAMLTTPVSPIAVPGLPYLAPTSRTIVASSIAVLPAHVPASLSSAQLPSGMGKVSGMVENVNLKTGAFFVVTHHLRLTGVTLTPTTRFYEPHRLASPLLRVQRGERVVVYGRVAAGSVTAHRIADLRNFVEKYDVGAIVVELGRVDSAEVATWVREALGPPTRAGAGGEIWIHIHRPTSDRVALGSAHAGSKAHVGSVRRLRTSGTTDGRSAR